MFKTEAREKRKVEELVLSTPFSCKLLKIIKTDLLPFYRNDSNDVRLKYVANVTWLQVSTIHALQYKKHISWL